MEKVVDMVAIIGMQVKECDHRESGSVTFIIVAALRHLTRNIMPYC